jgi:predicted DsbA family dithiol-disulfide isomerase
MIEVYADVGCPFTHVGLRRFIDRRTELGREDVLLWVRSWPLEVVNEKPLDASFIAEEIEDIRKQLAPDLFAGFKTENFPASSLPALTLALAAYDVSPQVGESVSLALRDLLFEQGLDVSDSEVLSGLATQYGVRIEAAHQDRVLDDYVTGRDRGVIGSPHFFTPTKDFFCPALDVSRDALGNLQVCSNEASLEQFISACFT